MSINRVAVSSVVRGASRDEPSGYIRIIDLETGRVLVTAPVPEARHLAVDQNPRGGLRGARGVSSHGDKLVIASNDTLFILDSQWSLQQILSHPMAGGIHDIHADLDGIWISSTAGSMALKLSWTGELVSRWHWTEDHSLVRMLGFRRWEVPSIDEERDYRIPVPGAAAHDVVHLNAVWRDEDRLLVSLGQVLTPGALRREWLRGLAARAGSHVPLMRRGVAIARAARHSRWSGKKGPAAPRKIGRHAIVALAIADGRIASHRDAELLWLAGSAYTPKHNLVPMGQSSLWFTDSEHGQLVRIHTQEQTVVTKIALPGSPPFARGALQVNPAEILVGNQYPAAVYRVHLDGRTITQSIDLGGKPQEAVYAIAPVPVGYDTDPTALKRLPGRLK